MRLCLILILLTPFASSAQTDSLDADSSASKKHICFSIKTDLLPLMNTLTEKGFTDYSICTAASFNRQYGLQLRFSYFNNEGNLATTIDMQYVYFVKMYEHAMLNAGAFCGFSDRKYSDEYLHYTDRYMQFGVSGGGNIRFTEHWHLSLSLLIGVQNMLWRKTEKGFSRNEARSMYSKVLLELGYRF
jgi:hypothetical protein